MMYGKLSNIVFVLLNVFLIYPGDTLDGLDWAKCCGQPMKQGIGEPFLQKQVLWENGENGIAAYFVYGLLVTEKGTVLVASEDRIHKGTEEGAHHIVIMRST